MNTNLKRSFTGSTGLITIFMSVLSLATSCKKSDNNNSPSIPGTYYGSLTSGAYTEADTIVIPSSGSSSIVMTSRTGTGSVYSINGTTSGASITIASQSVYIPSLSANYTVTGSGALASSTLTLNYAFKSAAGTTTNFVFTGTKQ